MPDETHELLVQVRSDTEDAEEGLDRVNDKFDETADETERTAGIVGDMSKRMQGFGTVIVATLTTLAAGIATQVPVIGESAAALGAIIDAIALKIDDDLRPSLSQFNVELFEIADNLARSEGNIGDFLEVLGRLELAWEALIPFSPLGIGVRIRAAVNNLATGAREMRMWIDNVLTDFQMFFTRHLSDTRAWIRGFGTAIGTGFPGLNTIFTNALVDLVLSVNWSTITNTLVTQFVSAIEQAIDAAKASVTGGDVPSEFDFGPGVDIPRGNFGEGTPLTPGGLSFEEEFGQGGQASTLKGLTIENNVNVDGRTVGKSASRVLGRDLTGSGHVTRTR